MANRFPLVLDTTDSQLKELPLGDDLELTGSSIIGVQNITAVGNINAADIVVNGESITTSIDYNNLLNKPVLAPVATSGIYGDLQELPTIPEDVSQLTDNFGLLSGSFTDLSDTPDNYIGRAGQFLRVNVGETGLELATVSTSGVTDQDIIDALGYTPYDATTNSEGFISGFTGQDVRDALGYNPYDGLGNPLLFINDDAGIISALGYTPYNAATNTEGYINSALGISDALGYTPYDGDTNPNGYINTVSESDVTGALGYTPYNGTANSLGFINSSQGITDVLGFTPYNGTSNPLGFLTSITDTQIVTALGYTPYSNANPNNYIALTSLSGTGNISFNQTTGVISFNNTSGYLTTITDTLVIGALGYTPYNGTANPSAFINSAQGISDALGYTPYNGATNPSGFLTAEADTLATVTTRGGSTTNNITVGALTSGTISGSNLTLTGDISFNSTGSRVVDGGTGSSIRLGGTSTITLGGPSAITVQTGIIPNNNNAYDLGTTSARYANAYVGQGLYFGTTLSSNAATATFSASSGSINITTTATGRTHVTTGVFRMPNLTTAAKNTISGADGDMVYDINRIVPQIFFQGQWRDVFPQSGAQPATPWFGMIAIADGSAWNPKGDGSECLMCYLNDSWTIVA